MTTTPQTYLVGGGLFFLLIISGIWLISEAQADENLNFADSQRLEAFNQTFSKLDDYNEKATSLQEGVRDLSTTQGGVNFFINLIGEAWNVVRFLFDSFSILVDVIEGIGAAFGLPGFVSLAIVSIISLIFGIGLLALIFNRSP